MTRSKGLKKMPKLTHKHLLVDRVTAVARGELVISKKDAKRRNDELIKNGSACRWVAHEEDASPVKAKELVADIMARNFNGGLSAKEFSMYGSSLCGRTVEL